MLNRQLILTIVVLVCSMEAVAQDHGTSNRRMDGLIGSLDDSSWIVREQSTRMLGDPNEGFELDMFADALERGDLSPEARLRLKIAARELFGQTTKAGLGVGFGAVRDGGVEIGTVVADVDRFPAAGMLVPMDLIVGAEGKPLTTSEELRAMILSHEPGETLNLMVRRGERVLDLDLPLGSYEFLKGAAPISPRVADRAIEIRWARRGISIPASNIAGSEISVDDWIIAGYPEEPGSFRASNARRSPKLVSPGSGRDVFVGVGSVVRGRIEPWSNRSNASVAIVQARRIELSKQMNIARMQIQLLRGGAEVLTEQAGQNPNDGTIKIKLNDAIKQLRISQDELDRLTNEFDSLSPSP